MTPAGSPANKGVQTSGDNWGQSGATMTPAGSPANKGFEHNWGQKEEKNTSSNFYPSTYPQPNMDIQLSGDNKFVTPPHLPHYPQKCQNSDSERVPAGATSTPDKSPANPTSTPDKKQSFHLTGKKMDTGRADAKKRVVLTIWLSK